MNGWSVVGQSGGEARADNWPWPVEINAQDIGVGLAQTTWLPHEQRAIQEESRLRQLDRRAMAVAAEQAQQTLQLPDQYLADQQH